MLPPAGRHQYCTVFQLLSSHLHRAPLVILLTCTKLQVCAHPPGIHRSWKKVKEKQVSNLENAQKWRQGNRKQRHHSSPSLVTAKLTDAPQVTLQAASIPVTGEGSFFSSASWPRPRRPYSALPRLYTCPKPQHADVKVLTNTQNSGIGRRKAR